MSGFLLLLVIDWIMKRSTADNTTGIRWNMTSKLDDLDYADDIALLTSSRDQMQVKVDRLVRHAKSTGLKINASKTKVMRVNANKRYQEISYPGEFVPRRIRTQNEWVRILWLIRTWVRIIQRIRTLHIFFIT